MRGRYPRSRTFRDEQSRTRRYAAARTYFYAAVADGAPAGDLLDILGRLEELSPDDERYRWRPWRRAIERGGRIVVAVVPAEIIAGRDLADLERIRAAADPAALLED